MQNSGSNRPIHWTRPNAHQLTELVRFNAINAPEKLFFLPHALDRQMERSDILDLEAWEVLCKGHAYDEPEAVNGGWMIRMEHRIKSAGRDAVALVEIIQQGSEFLVTTVMWKDLGRV